MKPTPDPKHPASADVLTAEADHWGNRALIVAFAGVAVGGLCVALSAISYYVPESAISQLIMELTHG